MGLFDSFCLNKKCVNCGEKIYEWQTKELDQSLTYWHLYDDFCCSGLKIVEGKIAVLGYCFKCRKATHGYAVIKNGKFHNIELIKGVGE